MENHEIIIFSNRLGSVSDKRLILNKKNGSEYIFLNAIGSIGLYHVKNYALSIVFFLLALLDLAFLMIAIKYNLPALFVLILIFILPLMIYLGVIHIIGYYKIAINVRGYNNHIKVKNGQQHEAKVFVDAVSSTILKNQ
jgi:hypothetical protein